MDGTKEFRRYGIRLSIHSLTGLVNYQIIMIMRKILIISITAFTAALFIGCSDSDYSYTSNYIYKNDSSRDITMKSYNYANGDLLEDANYTFVIPAGKAHTLRFDTEGGFPYPFMWTSPTGADYIA